MFAFFVSTPDEDPASTLLDEEVLGSSKSSSNSEDMDAAAAEAMLDVKDLKYEDEDEDSSSDDEEGVRRYLRANGMDRRLEKMTKVKGYKCKPSCMNNLSKCRNRCKVVNGNTRCVGGHLPRKCKNNCCSGGGSSNSGNNNSSNNNSSSGGGNSINNESTNTVNGDGNTINNESTINESNSVTNNESNSVTNNNSGNCGGCCCGCKKVHTLGRKQPGQYRNNR